MIHNAYVVYDSAAQIYNKPFYLINDQVAMRAAQDLIDDQNTDIARHPEQFSMFKIGIYDDETALFTILDTPINLVRFHELTPKQKQLPLEGQLDIEE